VRHAVTISASCPVGREIPDRSRGSRGGAVATGGGRLCRFPREPSDPMDGKGKTFTSRVPRPRLVKHSATSFGNDARCLRAHAVRTVVFHSFSWGFVGGAPPVEHCETRLGECCTAGAGARGVAHDARQHHCTTVQDSIWDHRPIWPAPSVASLRAGDIRRAAARTGRTEDRLSIDPKEPASCHSGRSEHRRLPDRRCSGVLPRARGHVAIAAAERSAMW